VDDSEGAQPDRGHLSDLPCDRLRNRTEFEDNEACCQATVVRNALGNEIKSTFDAANRKIAEKDALG
jgi:hypothetical protein